MEPDAHERALWPPRTDKARHAVPEGQTAVVCLLRSAPDCKLLRIEGGNLGPDLAEGTLLVARPSHCPNPGQLVLAFPVDAPPTLRQFSPRNGTGYCWPIVAVAPTD